MAFLWPECGGKAGMQEGWQQEFVTMCPASWMRKCGFPTAILLPGMWM